MSGKVEPTRAPRDRPQLVFFHSPASGRSRRVEGFLAQVLQRRSNHHTFRLYRVAQEERPDLLNRFQITTIPTLLVIHDKRIRGCLEQPKSASQIATFLEPWLR